MNTIFPLLNLDALPPEFQFVPAILVGIAFGFVLERSGFGDARVLAGQFYFHNMRVFKVMFTSIITAAAGLAFFDAVGLLNFSAIFIPATYIWPHIAGGFLLGAGFIISGYCPGTSVVASASGKWDGFLTFAGVIGGSLIFGQVYPDIAEFHTSTAKGVMTINGLTGIPYSILIFGVVVMAVMAFWGAEKVEKIFSAKLNRNEFTPWNPLAKKALGGIIVLGMAAIIISQTIPAGKVANDTIATEITEVELAEMIIERPSQLFILDIRDDALCRSKERIPNALCVKDVKKDLKDFYKGRTLVVYGQNEQTPLPDAVQTFPGKIAQLSGGYAAWKSVIIENNPPQDRNSPNMKNLVGAIHSYFTGAKVANQPIAKPRVIRRKIKKGGGCS